MAFFHPDGRRLCTVMTLTADGRDEGRARLWDARTGEALTPPLRHAARINHAEFTADGLHLVCACEDGRAYVWRLPEADTRPAAELLLLSEILSGERRDLRSGSLAMTRVELRQAWEKYASSAAPLAVTAAEQLDWHDREAASAEAAGQTSAALFHLDRLLAARPDEFTYHARRAHVHAAANHLDAAADAYAIAARLATPEVLLAWYGERAEECKGRGQWAAAQWYLDRLLAARPDDRDRYLERAHVRGKVGDRPGRIADLTAALDRGADGSTLLLLAAEHEQRNDWAKAAELYVRASETGPVPWYVASLVCLKANDLAGYRRLCGRYLELVETHKVSAHEANDLAWVCALGQDALPDYSKPVAWLEESLAQLRDNQHRERHDFRNTLAGLLYRTGRYEDAIREVEQGMKEWDGKSVVQDWLILALAHRKLGHEEETQKCEAKVAEWKPQPVNGVPW
jgi:tetratricopeptide (TPR) repeat protein